MKRVVITGMGIWSCLGTSIEEVKESLFNGKSGIGIEEERISYGYQSALTGIVKKPELKGLIDRHLRRGLSEEAEYAFMASSQAFKMANIDQNYLDNNDVGCIFGNDSSAKPVIEASRIMDEKHDTELLGQSFIFQAMNSTVTMNISTIYRLKGVNFTISAACASGSHSIGLAYLLIKNGLQDVVLCGGAQETNFYSMASFDALGAFSKNMQNPTKASRPFDKDRDGLVPSGGAAALVLEDYDHAVARGANIIAEVIGYGFSSNGTSVISQPSDEGCLRAMQRAIADAKIEVSDIDYINAHGTSTHLNDSIETKVIKRIFGENSKVKVSSTKGNTGHLLGAAGVVEAIISTKAIEDGIIPPTINYKEKDEECDLNLVVNACEKQDLNVVMSNSLGFGGHNASIILKKYVK